MITAIVIPVDMHQPVRLQQIDRSDLDAYRSILGGHLELVNFIQPPASMYVNEEGKLEGLEMNQRATMLMWTHNSTLRHRDVIAGPALLVGPADPEGWDTSVPTQLVELLTQTKRYRVEVQFEGSSEWSDQSGPGLTDWVVSYRYAIALTEQLPRVEEVRVVADVDQRGD